VDLGLSSYDRMRVHMHRMGLGRLEALSRRLAAMPLSERSCVRGLEPGRADLIIPGIILTITFMKSTGSTEMLVSDQGLLEGVFISLAGGVDDH
jgi:exopolyphosphatase/guanosine-5'-triphosphate,3'-diphosphate pyrophosphatase